jgi:hypothetical protein
MGIYSKRCGLLLPQYRAPLGKRAIAAASIATLVRWDEVPEQVAAATDHALDVVDVKAVARHRHRIETMLADTAEATISEVAVPVIQLLATRRATA